MIKNEDSDARIALARTNIETAAIAVAHTGVVPTIVTVNELDWYDAPLEPVCEYRFEPGPSNQHRIRFVVTEKGMIDVYIVEFEDVARAAGIRYSGGGRYCSIIEGSDLATIESFLRLAAAGAFAVTFINLYGLISFFISSRGYIDPTRLNHPLLIGHEFTYFDKDWILDRSKLGRYTRIVSYEPWGLADTTHVVP